MRRLFTICLLALSAAAVLVSAPAAAGTKASKPSITRVTPMRVSVGNLLTIRGRNFKAKRAANTVIFRSSNGRTAFAKPRRATSRKLVVVVPAAVARLLNVAGSRQRPTRLKLRVLAGRFSDYTPRRLSPVVTGVGRGDGRAPGGGNGPAGGGGAGGGAVGGGPTCAADADHDNDLLANDLEARIKTDPCLADTDRDGVEDGFEQLSALRLNRWNDGDTIPYPGKRPFPNALDPSDAATDYDGDGLSLSDEFRLWRFGGSKQPLDYSDGDQRSANQDAPVAPPLAAWAIDMNSDGKLSDDERDADGDGLTNWDEAHGRMTPEWWVAKYNGTNGPKETKYPVVEYPAAVMDDPDSDGDGVPDGADDQDRDGLSNAFEVRRPDDWPATYVSVTHDGGLDPNPWARVHPFNPCKPLWSARCHLHPPFGAYPQDEDWASPLGFYPADFEWSPALPPEINPDTPPATPALG
jgi:hypothetical protein